MPQSNPLAPKQVHRGWLGLPAVGALACLAWLVVRFGDARAQQVQSSMDERWTQQQVEEVLQLDEAMALAARLAVVTGDAQWEDRHGKRAEEMDEAMDELLSTAAPDLAGPLKENLGRGWLQRQRTEHEAMERARRDQQAEARELFESRAYVLGRESFREHLQQHRADMAFHQNGLLRQAVMTEQVLVVLAVVFLLVALGLATYGMHLLLEGRGFKKALAEEQAKHSKLLSALDCVEDGILITDRKGLIRYVNQAYCSFTGANREELIGASTRALNAEEILEDVHEEVWGTLRRGEAWAGRIFIKNRDGQNPYGGHWSSLHLTPLVQGDEDRLTGYIGTLRNITAEVEVEEEANLRHEFATALTRVGMKLDGSGETEPCLTAALTELTYGTGFREDLGAAVLQLGTHAGEVPLLLASCGGFDRFDAAESLGEGSAITQNELRNYQVFIGLSDDLLPAEELAGYMIVPFEEEGDFRGVLVVGCEGRVAGDVMFMEHLESMAKLFGARTLRSQVRSAMERSIEAAMQSNRLKTRFLAKMSQEIRTPMTSIVGYSDLLLDGERSAEDHEHASQMIREGARELLELVDGIIDISNMESGTLQLDCAPISPLGVLSRVVQGFAARARSKGVRLELQVEGPVPAEVNTDSRRLRQVFTQVIGNALKFTEVGSVLVRARVSERREEGMLEVAVIDTGIGILHDQRGKLFEAFQHIDGGRTRRSSGAGLGLAISRGLIRLLGGDLVLGDSETSGSTFTVSLPLGDLEQLDLIDWEDLHEGDLVEVHEASMDLPFRLLLAEDNRVNQRVISRLLETAGAEVEIAATGLEAIRRVEEAAGSERPFDGVLMDLMMPEMDGLSATRRLRQAGYSLPIIALTADARIQTSLRCKESGCDGFATKPVEREELFALVSESIAKHRAESSGASS